MIDVSNTNTILLDPPSDIWVEQTVMTDADFSVIDHFISSIKNQNKENIKASTEQSIKIIKAYRRKRRLKNGVKKMALT